MVFYFAKSAKFLTTQQPLKLDKKMCPSSNLKKNMMLVWLELKKLNKIILQFAVTTKQIYGFTLG